LKQRKYISQFKKGKVSELKELHLAVSATQEETQTGIASVGTLYVGEVNVRLKIDEAEEFSYRTVTTQHGKPHDLARTEEQYYELTTTLIGDRSGTGRAFMKTMFGMVQNKFPEEKGGFAGFVTKLIQYLDRVAPVQQTRSGGGQLLAFWSGKEDAIVSGRV
jgi:hypothetical protein